ncbi:MAG: ATP synthase F1 subunit delta [Bdellovibrionota bacterium]
MAQDKLQQYSNRYARAFLDLLAEHENNKSLESINQELQQISVLGQGENKEFFHNPVFNLQEKEEILKKIFSKHKCSDYVARFVMTLVSMNHLHLIGDIAQAFDLALRERNQQTLALIRTAFPLSKTQQENISKALEKTLGKEIQMEIQEDQTLIGGLVANVGGVVYDASVLGYLHRMAKSHS